MVMDLKVVRGRLAELWRGKLEMGDPQVHIKGISDV